MSTRYGDRGFGRYGDSDEDRTEDYTREGERDYSGRAGRADYGAQTRGYAGGRGDYGRDNSAREYGSREYGQRDYGSRDYSSPYGTSRYGREGGGGGYAGPPARRHAGEDYVRDPRDLDARGYGRDYARVYGRDKERGYVRGAGDERDEVRSFDTDYGRTTSRFYGSSGYEYGRDDYDDRDERGAYRGREYGVRDERRDEGGVRGWLDRAAEGVRSFFGEEGGGQGRGDDPRSGRGAGGFRGRGPRNYHRSDDRIREDVSERLTDNDWLDASDVEVNVVAGEVILTGSVDSRYAKRLAEEICESASGVANVQNNLRVRNRQAAEFDPSVTAGAGTAALPVAPDITATSDAGPAATSDLGDTDTPAVRSSRAAGKS
jgi:osmotically-inducible protein OsmY